MNHRTGPVVISCPLGQRRVGGSRSIRRQPLNRLDNEHQTLARDGLINMPHMEDPHAIELAGKTLAGLRQPAATG